MLTGIVVTLVCFKAERMGLPVPFGLYFFMEGIKGPYRFLVNENQRIRIGEYPEIQRPGAFDRRRALEGGSEPCAVPGLSIVSACDYLLPFRLIIRRPAERFFGFKKFKIQGSQLPVTQAFEKLQVLIDPVFNFWNKHISSVQLYYMINLTVRK
jgi:hypothetical protein